MADDNKQGGAQSKLGELFIDIGSSGLGTLVKGLNSVSASFLLTKNAATQALKPIISMSQKGGNTVTTLDKLSSVTGLTLEQLQRLQIQATLSNTSFEELTGQIQVFQKTLQDILLKGKGNNEGFAWLGLSPRDFDPSKPLEALDKISQRVMQLRPEVAAYALDELGISRDLIYYWQQGTKEVDQRAILEKDELKTLRKQQDAWNNLKMTSGQMTNKLMANLPVISDIINQISNTLMNLVPFITNTLIPAIQQITDNIKNTYENIAEKIFGKEKVAADKQYMEEMRQRRHNSWQGILSRLNYQAYRKQHPSYQKSYREWQKDMGLKPAGSAKPQKNNKPLKQQVNTNNLLKNLEPVPKGELDDGGSSAEDYSLGNVPMPITSTTNNSSINNNVNVTVNQNITSPDPQTAADLSFDIIDDEINRNMIERANLGNR